MGKIFIDNLGLNITNPPTNVTVCINTVAEINCGFIGANPNLVTPNWRIIMRNDNGSIVSNETILGGNIAANLVSSLEWVPDTNSGEDNASNSKLIFGPVNNTIDILHLIGIGNGSRELIRFYVKRESIKTNARFA